MTKTIYILGIGHNSPVYYELVEACGFEIAGLYHYDDSRTGQIDHGYTIVGSFDELFARDSLAGMNFALSQGDNWIRQELFDRILAKGGDVPTLVHPTAQVSRFSCLGRGVVVHMMGVVHPDVTIGDNTVLSCYSSLMHTTSVGKHCYMAAGTLIGAYTHVEDLVFMGQRVTTISGKVSRIGKNAVIGAGSLITKSVEEGSIMQGSPARVMARKSNE